MTSSDGAMSVGALIFHAIIKFNSSSNIVSYSSAKVTDHDLKSDFCHIKHSDGDAEDMTFAEIK